MAGEPERAIVLGAGVAGIAASLALADRGWRVDLLESRSRLGGRVFSVGESDSDDRIDNGPHVMLGCYDHMRSLLRRIGTEREFEQPASLTLLYREESGRLSSLSLSRWPVPLAMPAALLRFRGMTFGERVRALRGMLSALRGAPAAWSIEDWLTAKRQQGGPRRFLWDPLCRAVMNADPREVSADLFLRTLRRAFSGSAKKSAIWIPRQPWGRIVGEAAGRALDVAGVGVRLGCRVAGLRVDGGRVREIDLTRGEPIVVGDRDLVVSAFPWRQLARVMPTELRHPASRFEGRAIVNVYFDMPDDAGPPDEGPLIGFAGGQPFHFLYRTPGNRPGRFALIAGASRELNGKPVAAIEQDAREQLARYYSWRSFAGGSARVTKEAEATVLASPDRVADRPEPGPVRGLDNLLLCGDWTQTHLPSTLEAAAESAARMMEHIPEA